MDRADIYAAMLSAEEDEQDAAEMARPMVRPNTLNFEGGAATSVNGVDVATLAYVRRLEKIVQQQSLELKKMAREMRGLELSLRQQRTIVNNHVGRFSDIQRELDDKIDRRS